MGKRTAAELLFSVDYSQDELAVIAGLFTIPAMPGAAPAATVDDGLRSAAARSLVARRVLEFTDSDGVEIAQPHATVLSLTLVPRTVVAFEQRTGAGFAWKAWYVSDGGIVQQEPVTGVILRYTLVDGFDPLLVTASLSPSSTGGGGAAIHVTEAVYNSLFDDSGSDPDLPQPLSEAWSDTGSIGRVRVIERNGTAVTIDEITWLASATGIWQFQRNDVAISATRISHSELSSRLTELLQPSTVPKGRKPRHR